MGLKNLPAITAALLAAGRAADTPVAVVQEGTTGDQRTLRATLGTVAAAAAEAGIRPPADRGRSATWSTALDAA